MLKVRVRDFQSIEDATLEIDGLTVLTGTNNAGKSAFFRAIRGAFTNARGYDFVRQGKPHCTVDIEFDDGRTLTWKKGKGVNTYVVNGEELPKVGHGVPAEAAVFGVEPVRAANAELWPQIAPQITGVSFLLHEQGSAIAEAVADVHRVNQLSRALKDCESDKRSTRSKLKVRRKDAKTLAEKMEGFAGLDDAVEAVEGLEKRHGKAQKVAKANANLVKLRDRVRSAREAVESLHGLQEAAQKLPPSERVREVRGGAAELAEARGLGSRVTAAREGVGALEGLEEVVGFLPSEQRLTYVQQFRKAIGVTVGIAVRYEEAKTEHERAQEAQEALEGVSLDDSPLGKLQKLKKAFDSATRLQKRREEHRASVASLDQQIRVMEQELEKVTERASEVLGTYEECPTCGSNLDHVH